MSNSPKQTAQKRLSRAEQTQKKLHGRGPFKLKVGSRVFRYRFPADYSAARELLSKGRYRDVGQQVEALQSQRTNIIES